MVWGRVILCLNGSWLGGSLGLAILRVGREHAGAARFRRRLGFVLALVLLVTTSSGCASLGRLDFRNSAAKRLRTIPLRIERSEIPPDYDFLVAEFAQIDGDFELARVAYERAAEKDPRSAIIHERLSRLAWQLDDVDGAVREGELALSLDPDSLRIRLFLGRLYRLRRNFQGLDRVLRDASGGPLNPDSAYVLYQVTFERGELAEAEALARELLETEPGQLRGILALAGVYEKTSKFDSAESTVRRGLEAFPNHFLLFMRLAEIERARGNRSGEISVYREILEGHPDHYGILARLGQAQIDGNDIDGAIETFGRLVERYGDDTISLRRLASLEFSAGRYESAAARLEAVLARDADQPELAFALGQIRKATGDKAAALKSFDRIRPQDPKYFDARIEIAALHESEGRFDQAIEEIKRLRLSRPDRQLDFHIAGLTTAGGDFARGIEMLEGMLDGSSADTDVLYQLGVQYGTHGDVEKALSFMQRVIEAEPDNANALNYIGYSWAERGENLEEAEALIRRALALSPQDGFITDSLGWVYYKKAEILFEQSRTKDALRLLDRAYDQLIQAAELTGGDSVVSEHLGDVLLLRGDKQGALERFDEAVSLGLRESEQPQLLEKRERLRGDLGLPVPDGEAP
jgi:tetratricopeptide (TPR) repeat protein